MAAQKLKVAILSMSGQQASYAPAFYDNPRVEVVAITEDESPAPETVQRNRETAQKFGVPYIEKLDDVLAREDVAVVSLCSTLERRVALAQKIARAGKHILGDKPLTNTLAEIDAIRQVVDASRSKNGERIKFMVGHNYRFNPAILQARQLLQAGNAGLPWAIHSDWVIAAGKRAAPVGEFRNHAMYPLDAMLYLVASRPQTVYATTGAFFFENAKAGGVEDMGFITMNMDHGIIATTSLGRSPIQNHLNGGSGDMTIRIMGTHGMLVVDANRPHWLVYGKSGAKNMYYGPNRVYDMVDHFVDCVLHDRSPMCGLEDARNALEVTLAALQSAKENRVIKLPLQ
ncbi:MAG: Gfo/Idh/MocA family oxidoreductase [Chloroflexi bacterium]|nr:Gfo/Idh/MocA family oxidoreductase [Chloroflexota bacterium]